MSQGVLFNGEVKWFIHEAEGKPIARSLRGAGCARPESLEGYPKPVDLYLGRMKPEETRVEVRTVVDVQITRMTWV